MGECQSRWAGLIIWLWDENSGGRSCAQRNTVNRRLIVSSTLILDGLDFTGAREWSCGCKPGRRPRIQLHRPAGLPETDKEKHTGLCHYSAKLKQSLHVEKHALNVILRKQNKTHSLSFLSLFCQTWWQPWWVDQDLGAFPVEPCSCYTHHPVAVTRTRTHPLLLRSLTAWCCVLLPSTNQCYYSLQCP